MINEATRLFIRQHRHEDLRQTALKYGKTGNGVDMPMALQQMAGWQTARGKLPSWAARQEVIYPVHLSMEQCSGEATARYKAKVARQWMEAHGIMRPHAMTDLTGGFGVDFTLMAPLFGRATYVEQNSTLAAIVEHNLQVMQMQNTRTVCADAADHLHGMSPVTMLFADPARRDLHGNRTFAISDCTPNVKELKPLLMQKAQMVMLKLSPMLDWRKAVADMAPWVSQVHIVSVNNECKELLLLMEHPSGTAPAGTGHQEARVVCHGERIDSQGNCTGCMEEEFRSPWQQVEPLRTRQLPPEGWYLYEPDAAWMKAGLFEQMEQRYGMMQLSPNSHLFTSNTYQPSFPGRHFAVTRTGTMGKDLKKTMQGVAQANITVRNFPLSVADLRKRLRIKEGGSTFIFATTLWDKSKVLLVCERLGDGFQHTTH
ncbi:MAG: SAM-dependent methyltransferase [Prevotella sp.]